VGAAILEAIVRAALCVEIKTRLAAAGYSPIPGPCPQ
jgi:hypothetical protein